MFQAPPTTPEELEAARPLALSPDQVNELSEEEWYARAFRGHDSRQLTFRAVAMGSILGFLLAFTNLYVGLKIGLTLGVAITACIVSYAVWGGLLKVGIAKTPMTLLENNCMQSTASAAGYSTGATMVSAIPAMLILSATPENPQGHQLPFLVLAGWVGSVALLGTALAIPMKRNLINQEKLKFPSGLAAAVTLQGLYASGEEAARKARTLLTTAAFGAIIPLFLDLNAVRGKDGREPLVDGHAKWFDFLPARGTHTVDGQIVAYKPSDWNLLWDLNPVLIAGGALVGLRVATSMLAGALFLSYYLGPLGLDAVWTNLAGVEVHATSLPSKDWKEVGLWLGAPMMVSSGLLAFALQWRTILRAFQGLRGGGGGAHADVEVPTSWFAIGTALGGLGVVVIAWQYFGVPPHLGVLGVVMAFVLALVAARATGESDFTPTGAMGKLVQLTYGVLIPQNSTANLMTAAITAGSASACADLLNDLKSGYLLGASPRRQFLAQASGILSGTIATTVGFYLLVPDATALTGTDAMQPAFPAPAAQSWRAVAEVFKLGIGNLHPMDRELIYVGLLVGVVLVAMERLAPVKWRSFLPSATGLGLGLILPSYFPISLFAGALLAEIWKGSSPRTAEPYLVPAASGLIAGISIMGVVVAVLNNILGAS